MLWLNGERIEVPPYPNGEARMPVIDLDAGSWVPASPILGIGSQQRRHHCIHMAWRSDADLIHLAFLAGHLHRHGASASLEMEYMPYSRMDREQGGSCFTLAYTCELINSLRFTDVAVWEPHSHVTLDLLDNSIEIRVTPQLVDRVIGTLQFWGDDFLVFPDKGAAERYEKSFEYNRLRRATLSKERDFASGRITHMEIATPTDGMPGRRALIVDDLCSYGGTFSWAAQLLHEAGITDVYLLVAHLEPAAFRGELLRNTDEKKIVAVFASESLMRLNEREIGDPFASTPIGYVNQDNGSSVRLYTKEEWRP